jgi:hypothetical protein
LIALPGDPMYELLGDTITEDLKRILATFCAATPELLEPMIDDPQVDFFVRWAAAQAFAFLVRDGRVSREDAVERLRTRLDNALDRADGELTSALVSTLLDFYPREAMPSIERAFRLGLVDPMMIRRSNVEEEMNEPDAESCPRLKRLRETRICDTVEELRPYFARREDRYDDDVADPEPEFGSSSLLDDYEAPHSYREDTIRYEAPKVGRNDPCPCGSGKKFKKCCLRSGTNAK